MSDAVLIAAIGLTFAFVLLIRGLRRRRLREAAAPVGAAASVLRDVYSGNGTQPQAAAEFDPAPSMSMTLDGEDPLQAHGLKSSNEAPRD